MYIMLGVATLFLFFLLTFFYFFVNFNCKMKLELRDRTQLAVYYLQRSRKCDKNK